MLIFLLGCRFGADKNLNFSTGFQLGGCVYLNRCNCTSVVPESTDEKEEEKVAHTIETSTEVSDKNQVM